jgi:membrane-bound serine protease (ClpP class)
MPMMKCLRVLLLVPVMLAVAAWAQPVTPASPQVFVLTAEGPMTPAMAEYLDRGLARAAAAGGALAVVQLDTPGGQIDVMTRMVQAVRASTVPVVIYVSPRGAIAGSAGTLLTLAGHAAAMAPETAIGAASPVGPQGEDLGTTIAQKEKEILKASARSMALRRGPQAVALVESAIDNASAASAEEALKAGMIDFIASDLPALLKDMDGFEVETSLGPRTVHTAGYTLVEVQPSLIEQMLQALTDPNVVFLLISLGTTALLIELSNPGGWIAGFIGIVSLALGGYGLGILPVNWFGLIFMALAFGLFILDIKAPTHGALTAAGLTSFIVGALVLFNSPGTPAFERVSIPLVITVGVAVALMFAVVLSFALRAQHRPISVGVEALIGRIGEVRTALTPAGMIQVAGELWSAEVDNPDERLDIGARVVVTGVEGLRLKVRRQAGSAS